MPAWFFLLAGVVIGVALVVIARRRPAPPTIAPSTAPAPGPIALPPPKSLLELARDLESAYDSSAHPAELPEHAPFDAAVATAVAMPLDPLVDYATGANGPLAAIATRALALRDDGRAALARMLDALRFTNAWTNHYLFDYLLRHARAPVAGEVIVRAPKWWAENPLMPGMLSGFIDARVAAGESIDLGAALDAFGRAEVAPIEALLARLMTPHAQTLREQLSRWRSTRVDHQFLGRVGKILDPRAGGAIVMHDDLASSISAGLDALTQSPPRSFIVVGEQGTGKSTLVRALAAALAERGWTIFEATATDVGADMTYIGELEGRIRELVEALDVQRHIAWYAPAFHELFYAGQHRMNPAGILDMILPAVESGRIVMIGEAPPAALDHVLRQRPRVRGAFASLNLEPLAPAAASALGAAFLAEIVRPAGIDAPDEVVPEALELARHYLGTRALPGSLLDLLRLAHARAAKSDAKALTRETLLVTLTELTGLPASVLDERAALDPQGLRAHFAKHVMGQPEAVDCLVDRVAMLKAGLTDPHRPVGVFLFAGPTGTGKTEVARTLAAFLFGSADRMIRLDMSELQESSSLARIVGDSGGGFESNALVAQIRRQPFSVVLLDEFEKAHPRIWDLFLQVFDAGRLTDVQGVTADFRHSIIILTSNLGATVHQGSSLGFTEGASPFSAAQVTRAIVQTFRPEFVNRLDRVVVFRPLARGVMREILKKELAQVLKRRGFARREWAVEWEDSAIEFLLERGFTADMGARPLRRAIEEHVLAPIAMTIVERRHPEGDQFLFVRSDGARIQVQFVDPDAPDIGEPPAEEALPLAMRLQALDARLVSDPWLAAKSALYARMNASGFWEQPERYGVLDRIERIDRLEAATATARSLAARLGNRKGANARPLAEQLHLLEAALGDLDADRPGDVYLALEAVAEDVRATEREAWLARLAEMYTRWAKRRRMRCTTLGIGPSPVVLAIAGLGAHCILAREAGLHVFELPGDGAGRATVRVRVAPQPVTPRPRAEAEHGFAIRCLAADAGVPAIVRRYRQQPAPLVRDAVAGWRTGRLQQVLDGDFDLMGQASGDKYAASP